MGHVTRHAVHKMRFDVNLHILYNMYNACGKNKYDKWMGIKYNYAIDISRKNEK